MTTKEIIANWLKDNDFDGLINEDNECTCPIENVNLVGAELEEFIPCEALDIHNCKPAYMWECKVCKNSKDCKIVDDACMKSEKQIPVKYLEGR